MPIWLRHSRSRRQTHPSQREHQDGKAVVYSDGSLQIDGVPIGDGPNNRRARVFLRGGINALLLHAINRGATGIHSRKKMTTSFIIRVRRGSTHINTYNSIIQQAIRSNMNIKVRFCVPCFILANFRLVHNLDINVVLLCVTSLPYSTKHDAYYFRGQVILGNGDARGLVFHVLMYSTKSTRTVSTMLPLLPLSSFHAHPHCAPVFTRIEKEGRDEPNDMRAMRVVRASACRNYQARS